MTQNSLRAIFGRNYRASVRVREPTRQSGEFAVGLNREDFAVIANLARICRAAAPVLGVRQCFVLRAVGRPNLSEDGPKLRHMGPTNDFCAMSRYQGKTGHLECHRSIGCLL